MIPLATLVGHGVGFATSVVTICCLGAVSSAGCVIVRHVVGKAMIPLATLVGHGVGFSTSVVTLCCLGAVSSAGCVIVGHIVGEAMIQFGALVSHGVRFATTVVTNSCLGAVSGTGCVIVGHIVGEAVSARAVNDGGVVNSVLLSLHVESQSLLASGSIASEQRATIVGVVLHGASDAGIAGYDGCFTIRNGNIPRALRTQVTLRLQLITGGTGSIQILTSGIERIGTRVSASLQDQNLHIAASPANGLIGVVLGNLRSATVAVLLVGA